MKILTLHQQRANRSTCLPPPPGVDPQTILKEREYRYIEILISLYVIEKYSNLPGHYSSEGDGS